MKSDRKMPSPVSETRKIRKPLMEKKRRARINDSLETLKQILLDSKTTLKEPGKKSGQRTAKLEKADILEMTVHYIQNLKNKVNSLPNDTLISKEGQKTDSSCDRLKMGLTLVPTRLDNGELAFVIPSSGLDKEDFEQKQDMWRPW